LFWAALGIPPSPPERAILSGRRDGGRVWRYVAERDTMDFVEPGWESGGLLTEVRREGKIIASTEVRFRPGTHVPLEARLRFPQDGSALILSVEAIDTVATFDPSIWRRP
jgi:hypothetical protein